MNYFITKLVAAIMVGSCMVGSTIQSMDDTKQVEATVQSSQEEQEIELPREIWLYIYSLYLELFLGYKFTFSEELVNTHSLPGPGHNYTSINSMALSCDGNTLIFGGNRNFLLDLKSKTVTASKEFGRPIFNLAIDPSGTMRAFSSENKVSIEDIFTQKKVHKLIHSHKVTSIDFSPDGKTILTGSYCNNTAYLWCSMTGKLLVELKHKMPAENITSVTFSPDSAMLVTISTDGTLCLWNQEGQKLRTFINNRCSSVDVLTFSPDGEIILIGDSGGAWLWETNTGKVIKKLEEGHAQQVFSGVFSHDGTTVVTGSSDGYACVWDTKTGTLLNLFNDHQKGISAVAFSPDSTGMFTASHDGTIRLYTQSKKNNNWLTQRKETALDLFLKLRLHKEEKPSLTEYLAERGLESALYDATSMCTLQ